MNEKVKELLWWTGLTLTGLANQWFVTPERAQEIANEILSDMYDYYDVQEKIEIAKKRGQKEVYLKGYTIKLP